MWSRLRTYCACCLLTASLADTALCVCVNDMTRRYEYDLQLSWE